MGRKIPAKKHRGVKDPIQQQARRNQILKSKINAPPTDPDEQPVPRSLTELFSFRDSAAARKPKRKPTSASANVSGKGNPISRLCKLPGESGRGFSLRINSAIRALHDSEEAQEYPLQQELDEEDARGARMAALRARRQRRRAGGAEPAPRLSHKDKLKQKKAAAEQAAAAAARERPQYERVPFGERAAAPPALAPARRALSRPGRRDLLLSKLLPASATSAASVASAASAASTADRERRERARLAAIAAYRDLRRQKRKQ